ncbi:iron-containing alcohol dehydrogenase family protein [Nodosilinea sp. LEGE 06152]|uniref:iron-containing alcohol dehydrogenase family protein n=1 Tax=Nodosilinea sp. LEGE 06152 TaxID=2777966 RepID=UPI0018809337|nr:iron-containing alcohol dehydrogenase family protein [Nodosilinea sp. LEGE 06152]MBE9158113.1 iron-containing alcohol dehydrogenase family protein [Nodosilinea sp. LEGE 06152]
MPTLSPLPVLAIAPAQVVRGDGILADQGAAIARLGQRPLIVGGSHSLKLAAPLIGALEQESLTPQMASYGSDCSESSLERLRAIAAEHQADVVIGIGGGKALDTAKLLAHQIHQPVVTVPTSAATCAAWTALSNVYSDQGAFRYDVALPTCPSLLVLDYALVRTAPRRTLVAGIGDGLAKWYEAAVSSGASQQTLIVAAVQQARVLRDILLQKTPAALRQWGGPEWQEVVDATVLLAGVVGGVGGAQCRTVAAHAVHNGLTQLPASHGILHGEKVAYGILVQLRLEEMGGNTSLARAARQQLLSFYRAAGLPQTLTDLGLGDITLNQLQQAAEFACREGSDIHHLPFTVTPEAVMAAMVSPLCPELREKSRSTAPLRPSSVAPEVQP